MSRTNLPETCPKVSVLMITYDHEKYIEQAVRSVMMQETDFKYELVIGEDCSTDRTRDIVLRLKDEFPDKIKLLLHEHNIGMIPNMIATYNACHGEYIALLEGDDYWTSSQKLQIQVNYMEAHPECRICFHSAQILNEYEPGKTGIIEPPIDQIINFENWLRYRAKYRTYVATATIVFRSVNKPLPDWYHDLRFAGDWPLIVWLLQNGGNIGFIDERIPMTIYRKHFGSVTTTVTTGRIIDDLQDHLLVSRHLRYDLRSCLHPRFFSIYIALARDYALKIDYPASRKYLFKAVRYAGLWNRSDVVKIIRLTLRYYFPNFYPKLSRIKQRIVNSKSISETIP